MKLGGDCQFMMKSISDSGGDESKPRATDPPWTSRNLTIEARFVTSRSLFFVSNLSQIWQFNQPPLATWILRLMTILPFTVKSRHFIPYMCSFGSPHP
ncbi:uncharacterized protein G2W53_031190 [Senna tora]|uniref:Uncharacterized protein n=1 Tax=Senna tora TaxID=362788 RepID=A0A834WFA6_9FABA|nr:uncharacterized protein G2W53_031190 [Senna tora]